MQRSPGGAHESSMLYLRRQTRPMGSTWVLPIALLFLPVLNALADGDPRMLRAEPDSGFAVQALFTVGEAIGGYRPPGVPDGTGAWRWDDATVRLLVTHEFAAHKGERYRLANGTALTGARISYFDVDHKARRITAAGLAFREVRDRRGEEVTAARQISERGDSNDPRGFEALCSAAGYAAADGVFADDLLFVHEETSAREGHPHGGSVWALDVREQRLWGVPELGRGSWENVVLVETPDGTRPDGHIALLLSDDYAFGAAPLYLWIGRKDPHGGFLERNGLTSGRLHVWVADNADRTPEDFKGTGTSRTGRFVPLVARRPARSNTQGYDRDGYLNDTTLRARAWALGAFMFSRPEDLHANPDNGRHIVFASTGQGALYPADDWGALYLIRMQLAAAGQELQASARLEILHDGDDTEDFGIRNPDNLVWATDGQVYVQEDKATTLASFGKASGREASIWRIDPYHPRNYARIAEINRAAALPAGAVDGRAAQVGGWESSGVLDVSEVFGVLSEALLLLVTVQAHGVTGGPIGGRHELVEGGQLLLLSRPR